MPKEKFKRVLRPATTEERKRHGEIREKVIKEFPPSLGAGRKNSPPGIPAQIRRGREAKGLTWYAVAKLAGIPSPQHPARHRIRPRRSTLQRGAWDVGKEHVGSVL